MFGCAFRSILPRADVQRICLFDTWLSSVMVGRSVATVAELCFAMQWAIVLRELGKITHSDTAKNISRMIVPLIVLAECCSWYAVISTNFLGNVLENSLWTATFLLIAIALTRLSLSFRGIAQFAIAATAAGVAGYVVFMSTVDVPMYFARWQADLANGKDLLGFFAGLHDVATRWVGRRTTSPSGTTKSPGCRFISASRCGRAWCSAASAWSAPVAALPRAQAACQSDAAAARDSGAYS